MVVKASFAALALALSGCALANDVPPSIQVINVDLTAIGLMEQRLAIKLCVTNPNANEIAFRRVTANLDLAGAPLAEGMSDVMVRLPPNSSTAVPFTVVTTARNLGRQAIGIFRSGTVGYRVHGVVSLEGALGISLPYSRSGTLDPIGDGLRLAASVSEPGPPACVGTQPLHTRS